MTVPSLFDVMTEGLCNYGTPDPGADRRCSKPATHRAVWHVPGEYFDGSPNTRAGAGGIDCCREHANYYASAWFPIYPAMRDSCWIEVLAA